RRVVGRTRLQKTVQLLQRLGLPTAYSYTIHFYGPYSEGVNSDLRLLEQLKLVHEQSFASTEGIPYYILTATQEAVLPEMQPFQPAVDCLAKADPVVLELAATYDAFREMGSDHADALKRLQWKKGAKCNEGRLEKALELLEQLGLPAA
ncbi:MAG: hypothetical protein L0Z62_34785, partial [Gemmataceae bacterium]|nr:hypothetical protein [Gemmataceae bacterium]